MCSFCISQSAPGDSVVSHTECQTRIKSEPQRLLVGAGVGLGWGPGRTLSVWPSGPSYISCVYCTCNVSVD